jgi:YYY domain-containing protein
MREIALWGAVVELLGLAAAPLLRAAFHNRRDAALLCRPVGLALVAWAAWALTLLPGVPFERRTLLIGAAAVAAASWAAGRAARRRGRDFALGPLWGPDEIRGALLFWAPAAVFLLIRACLPEILGQEKFMDLAFLNSLVRNRAMPPLDPWMAGATINYYYWGYLLAASLARLSGVAALIAYNLAIATFAGYSFSAAACLGLRLSGGRWRAGIWSGIGAVFAGDLAGAFDAWKAPLGRGFDYWHASRVIGNGNTINEFPFFTFFQADLHPHLLAFPFFLAAFALGHRVLEIPSRPAPGTPSSRAERIARAWPSFLLAFLAGTARAANNWTLPALAILLVAVSALRSGGAARLPSAAGAVLGLIRGGGLLLLSLLLWYPYSRSYSLPANGLGWTTMKSGVFEFLFFWGILFVVAAVGLLGRLPPTDEAGRRRRDLRLALAGAAGLAGALATRTPALLVLLPLLVLAAGWMWSALREREPDPGGVYTGFLLLLGLSIVAGCEFVYFRDSYGVELQRMNTVFKFYHQAWPLLAIAAAVVGERAWAGIGALRRAVRVVLSGALVLALLYPADALLSRLRSHEGPFTLDARPALARRAPGDAEAIAWLDSHAPRGAVVLEATGDAYSEYARISSHTGIPTVLGWGNHEGLWRGNDREVAERAALIRDFYEGRDEPAAALFLQRYKVTHVVVGDLERQRHPTADRIAEYIFLTRELAGSTAVFSVHVAP